MKKKAMLKKIWKMYSKSKEFAELSLDQRERGMEQGYKGIEEVVWKIIKKETKRFLIDGQKVFKL